MQTKTRTVDPDVAKARSVKANAVKSGDLAGAELADFELQRAKRIAAIRRSIRNAPALTRREFDAIVAELGSTVAR